MTTSEVRKKVLLVDDEPGILRMFRTALAGAGFDIEEASDGRLALERLAKESFDVVVSDINMPGYGGLELLRSVHGKYPDMPMIMMTGKPSVDTSNKAMEHGAVRYLIKPVFPAALKDAVERAIESYEARRMKHDGVSIDCICASCGRVGRGVLVARHWQRVPLGWFVGNADRGLACSDVCANRQG
jgi:DNA-binding NtrC family response regulator